VDVYPVMEHSISTPKPVSQIVQLDFIPHRMNVLDVTVHAILAIKLELMGAYPAMEH
jgi:hypothetical protein